MDNNTSIRTDSHGYRGSVNDIFLFSYVLPVYKNTVNKQTETSRCTHDVQYLYRPAVDYLPGIYSALKRPYQVLSLFHTPLITGVPFKHSSSHSRLFYYYEYDLIPGIVL